MEVQNPYFPPAAPVVPPARPAAVPLPLPVPVETGHEEVHPEVFAPSTGKLVIMSLCTFGLYVAYWFYRNWRAISDQDGGDIWPFWRAVFAPLWGFSCFAQLNGYVSNRRQQLVFPPVALTLVFVLINFIANLSVFSTRSVGKNFWVIGLFTFIPLLPMNSLMRSYQQSLRMDMRRQDRLLVWHILIILFGGLLLLLALAGAFLGM